MTDYQRIENLLAHYSMRARAFSIALGLKTPQIFYDIKNGKCGVSKRLVNIIQEKYPEINPQWLLTGEGEMLKQPQQQVNIRNFTNSGENAMGDFFNITAPVNDHKASDELAIAKAEIKLLQELLNEKNERINELHEMIALLKNK